MVKKVVLFAVIQVAALFASFFVLALGLAGSHGHLRFSGDGGRIAATITIILFLPLAYLLAQRRALRHRKLFFSVAIALLALALGALYIGLPETEEQFLTGDRVMNEYPFIDNDRLSIRFTLAPEMFDRFSIEAGVEKKDSVEIRQLNATVLDDQKKVVPPVFRVLAWDSAHAETIQMERFFESNEYTKGKRFAITGQYSLAGTGSITLQINCVYTLNGQEFSARKDLPVRIRTHLIRERLIEY